MMKYALNATRSPTLMRPAMTSWLPETEQQREAREERALQADQALIAADVFLIGGTELLEFGRLLAIGADDADTREVFLGHGAHLRELRLDPLESPVDGRAEQLHRHRDDRQRGHRHHRQPGVDRGHQQDRHDKRERRLRGIHDRRPRHHAHGIEVVGRARHQVASAVGLVEGRRQGLQVCEKRLAQVVLHVPGDADHDLPHQEPKPPADEGDRKEHGGVRGQLGTGHSGRQVVDGIFEHPGRQQLDRRGRQNAEETVGEGASVADEVRQQAAHRPGGALK
jgi:hypothetical protein